MARNANELIGTSEAGQLLGVSGQQVRNFINNGMLPARQVAGGWVVLRTDLAKVPKVRRKGRPPNRKGRK